MFNNKDLQQIKQKGIELSQLDTQIKNFECGFPFANLVSAATPGNGIRQFNNDDILELVEYFDAHCNDNPILKFVPASGAASRMFKNLFNFLDSKEGDFSDKSFNSVYTFVTRIRDFAFYNDLRQKLAENSKNLEDLIEKKEYITIVDYLLNDNGLGYGNLPKGLLKFHQYDKNSRLPLEEHLVEAAGYATTKGVARVHFTVSPEHMDKFVEAVNQLKGFYENKFNVRYEISFSVQKSSTDTIAVDMDNKPFRNEDGTLLFRPAGHGALIENLKDLNEDIIFIKNIDNVVPDRLKPETVKFKKVIGGLLLKYQRKIFEFLKMLENYDTQNEEVNEIIDFAKKELNMEPPIGFDNFSNQERKNFIQAFLNRPIRICGMVKNEGEPGGGPFWVRNSKGEVSLQIVESSQIDQDNPDQNKIVQSATHFNPVDLVCGIKDYTGKAFDLQKFVDPETGFISIKSKDGKNLKAQELPGLWNGAMADWITIFVEVPIITFNPVKTVNDLLRPQHQPV
jgi:hypothetical protein